MKNQLLNNMLNSSKVMKKDFNNILKDQKSFEIKSYNHFMNISEFCVKVVEYYKANKETIGINQNAFLDSVVYNELKIKSSMIYDYIKFYNHENKIGVFENGNHKTIKETNFDSLRGFTDLKQLVKDNTPRTKKGKDEDNSNKFVIVHRFAINDGSNTDYINILSDGKEYRIKTKVDKSFETLTTKPSIDQTIDILKDEISRIENHFNKVTKQIKQQDEKVTVRV